MLLYILCSFLFHLASNQLVVLGGEVPSCSASCRIVVPFSKHVASTTKLPNVAPDSASITFVQIEILADAASILVLSPRKYLFETPRHPRETTLPNSYLRVTSS